MLTKVEIENFQSYRKAALDLVPGTNVIIGESDAGKSAVFRAINWVVSNRPLGDAHRSEWGGDTLVTLHTSEGDVIQRRRSATANEYSINGRLIKAFGSEVPEEVTALLQLDAANIQAQTDAPFLLADTPGEAARLLNKAASLDDIDRAVTNLKNTHAKIGNDIKYEERELTRQQEELQDYDSIPSIENAVQQVEALVVQFSAKILKVERLRNIAHSVNNVENRLKKTTDVQRLLGKHVDVQKQYDDFHEKKAALTRFKQLVYETDSTQEKLETTVHVGACLERIEHLQLSQQSIGKTRQNMTALSDVTKQITKVTDQIDAIQQKLTVLDQEFNSLSPETCPLCGNLMKGGLSKGETNSKK